MKKILIYILLAVFVITMSSPVMADDNPVYGSQSVTTGNVGIADIADTIEVKFTPKSRAVIIIDNDSIAADIFSDEFDFGYDSTTDGVLGSIEVRVNANIAVDVSLESSGFGVDHVFNDWVTYQMNYTGGEGSFDIQTYTPGAEVSVGWDDFVGSHGSETFDFEVHLTIPEGSTEDEWYDIAADTEVTDTVTITVSSAG